uniref:Uncharacterized protein n=1 Tax=Lutzomyia longipalpis TaxID=7200 RepID=A0A1B0CEZ6_LUTLO
MNSLPIPSLKLDVLGHDGDALGVDGTQIGVLKQAHEVSLTGFLKSHHGRALETQICLEILSNFTDQALEGQFADEQFCALLITTDLTESYRSWTVRWASSLHQ